MTASTGFRDGAAVGDLDVTWIHGSPAPKYNTDPDVQVHAYDEHTYVLRQNMAVNWEAPFMFLLFGHDRAVLLDTGATAEPEFFPLRATVDSLIDGWTTAHQHAEDYGLLVLHTHAHGDHTAADGQFAGRPHTQVVGAKRDAAWPFLGFTPGLEAVMELDLGGRVIDCLDTPGHDEAAVAYYDRYTRILFTGDTVYPGRLYVFDWPAFIRTIDRLADWCGEHPVSHVLGCHIEMTTTPGQDYPVGWTYQPDEPPLQLTPGHIRQLQDALREHGLNPARHVLPEMIIYPRLSRRPPAIGARAPPGPRPARQAPRGRCREGRRRCRGRAPPTPRCPVAAPARR